MSLISEASPADWPKITNGALRFLGQLYRACSAVYESGPTASRPTGGLWIGRPYFDTTLGYGIKYNGTAWVRWDGAPV